MRAWQVMLGVLVSVPLVAAEPQPTAEALIRHFSMSQIPDEGPWFTLTYRSEDTLSRGALPRRYDADRAAGSAIVALVTATDFSALHRLRTDEIWHYYGGDPLEILILRPDGSGETVVLGPNVLQGQKPQVTVPHGAWQGARPLGRDSGTYTLFGNTLAPGFEYADFEMGYRDELQKTYPGFAAAIARLTRPAFATRRAK